MPVETFTASNMRFVYIENQPYQYPADTAANYPAGGINTGWHVLPNQLMSHLLTPKQHWEFQMKSQAYMIETVSMNIFNMIPITETLAIQGNATFSAFNNTIYALGYTDKHYETCPFNWIQASENFTLPYKEGRLNKAGTWATMNLPIYSHPNSNFPLAIPDSALFWDPLNDPDSIMELRPGKNAISFHWNRHPNDQDKWESRDTMMWRQPEHIEGNEGVTVPPQKVLKQPLQMYDGLELNHYDYAVNTNYQNQWIKWNHAQTYVNPEQKLDVLSSGDPRVQTMFPITQWFIKLIPLFDANSALIQTKAQIGIQTTVTFKYKPRRSALYGPTYQIPNGSIYSLVTPNNQGYIMNCLKRTKVVGLPSNSAKQTTNVFTT
ncbi:MAG: hypothetical protein RSC68_19995 [Acinetobacter sp.]